MDAITQDNDSRYQLEESVVDATPSLSLPVEDRDLVSILNQKVKASEAYFDKKKIKERRRMNEDFFLGNQIDKGSLHAFQDPAYQDNMIWEDEERRITMASGQLPDIIITGPDKNGGKILQDVLSERVTGDVGQRIVKDALRSMDLNFIAAVKYRWDENIGETGDYIFELVDPNNMIIDHTAKIPHDGFTADNMGFITEWIEEPLGVVVSKFPKKKDELLSALGYKNITDQRAVSMIRYQETWFTWYGKAGEIIEGVCWKYKDIVLDKMKNPYWDWDGYKKPHLKKDNSGFENKHVYNNYFDRPRKPYIFFTELNIGKDAMNATSVIEQVIPLQKIVNKRGRQITEISDNAVPKKVFGPGMTKEQASLITNDPNQNVWIDDVPDLRAAMVTIPGQPPNPMLYTDKTEAKSAIDSKFATNQATKGELSGIHMSGYARQLSMQGDMTMSNGLVISVVNRAVREMAEWPVQLMKLFYDQEHYYEAEGDDGVFLKAIITNDLIVSGTKVDIKANTVDKTTRKNNAMALLPVKGIDPLSLLEDLDVPNPKERTQRLLAYNMASETGDYTQYLKIVGIPIADLQPAPPPPQPGMPMTPAQDPNQEVPVQENVPTGG